MSKGKAIRNKRRRWLLPALLAGLVVVIVVAIVLVLVLTGRPRSHQRVAYIDNNGDVAMVYDDGSGLRILTSGLGKVEYQLPRWSPDYHWLAAIGMDQETRQMSLWLAGAEEKQGRTIPLEIRAWPLVEWSPDSQQIAMCGQGKDGAWQLFLANVRGESRSIPLEMTVEQLAWSSDGQHIAMIGRGAGSDTASYILVADVAAGQVRPAAKESEGRFWTVDWMPDGQRFLATLSDLGGTAAVLYSFRADGSDKQPMELPGKEGTTGWPLYSPRGDRLAYEAVDKTTGVWSLLVAQADGTDPKTVVTSDNQVYPTEWSPDGSYLLFYERSKARLWMYDVQAGKGVALPGDADYQYKGCVFAPDTPMLACGSADEIVFLVYLDEGKVEGLAHGDMPDW